MKKPAPTPTTKARTVITKKPPGATRLSAMTMSSSLLRRLALSASVALVSSGCVTLGLTSGSGNDGASRADAPTVVQQPGRKTPVVSSFSNDYWLQMRDDQAHEIKRMYGMLATGEWNAATQSARAYLAKNPGNQDALTVLAAGLVLGKQYHLAGYYAGQLEKQNPSSPEALNIRGLSTMLAANNRLADFVRAQDFFQRAHDGGGNQIAPGLNLAHLQLELGNAEAALTTFQAVSSRCNNCAHAVMGQGIAASRAGKYDLAKDSFLQVLAANPQHTEARFHLALVEKNGFNHKKKAEEILHQLLVDSSNNDRAIKERAQSVLRGMKGELEVSERTEIVGKDKKLPANAEAQDKAEAEAMLTGG